MSFEEISDRVFYGTVFGGLEAVGFFAGGLSVKFLKHTFNINSDEDGFERYLAAAAFAGLGAAITGLFISGNKSHSSTASSTTKAKIDPDLAQGLALIHLVGAGLGWVGSRLFLGSEVVLPFLSYASNVLLGIPTLLTAWIALETAIAEPAQRGPSAKK